VVHHPADGEGEERPQHEVDADDLQGPTRPERPPGGHQGEAGGDHDEDGQVQHLELGHAVVELALERAHADQHGAGGEDVDALPQQRGLGVGAGLGQHEPQGDRAEGSGDDQLDVGRAPQGDVDPVGLVPHGVEPEGGHPAETQGDEKHGRPRDVEEAPAQCGLRLFDAGEEDGDAGGVDEATQSHQDHHVGWGEELLVTAVVDVPGHVPVKADDDDQQHDEPAERAGHGPSGIAGDALE
jgi:hypothetical protein